jgi:hypothetical protein
VALTLNSSTATTAVVAGDHTASELFIGQLYDAELRFMRPVVRQAASEAGFIPLASADYVVKSGEIHLNRSAGGQVVVTDAQGAEFLDTVNNESATAVSLVDEKLPFGVDQEPEAFDVRLRNNTHRTSNMAAIEWFLDLTDPGARVRF